MDQRSRKHSSMASFPCRVHWRRRSCTYFTDSAPADDGKHGVELFVGHVSVTASHEVKVTDETLEFGLVQDVIAIAIVTLPNAFKHLFGHHFGDSDLFEQPRTSFGIPRRLNSFVCISARRLAVRSHANSSSRAAFFLDAADDEV